MAPLAYQYPASEVAGDYARAGFGLAITVVPASLLPLGSVGSCVLLVLASLFAGLGVHTLAKHRARVWLDEQGIRIEPSGGTIAWSELEHMDLAYYSTRADRRKGWMQLTLKSGGQKLTVDSRLDGFADVVGQSRQAAIDRRLPLNTATTGNLRAMGLAVAPLPADFDQGMMRG